MGSEMCIRDSLDTVCYPNQSVCVQHSGYRWNYDLPSDLGRTVSAALGRYRGQLRVEVASRYVKRNLDQEFTSITFLDGGALPPPAESSDYSSTVFSSIGEFSSRSVLLAAYYRLRPNDQKISPYFGAGAGLSMVHISNIHYAERYHCEAVVCLPDASTYDNLQLTSLTGHSVSGHFFAGLDYGMSTRTVLSAEASFSALRKVTDQLAYLYHGVPGLTSETTISAIRQFALTVKVRRNFGRPRLRGRR